MTNLEKKARTYRLPMTTTSEDLGCSWTHVLNFGKKVILAGYFYNGPKANSYFAAVYEHTDSNLSCEGEIRLADISGELFEDEGHAVAWAVMQ